MPFVPLDDSFEHPTPLQCRNSCIDRAPWKSFCFCGTWRHFRFSLDEFDHVRNRGRISESRVTHIHCLLFWVLSLWSASIAECVSKEVLWHLCQRIDNDEANAVILIHTLKNPETMHIYVWQLGNMTLDNPFLCPGINYRQSSPTSESILFDSSCFDPMRINAEFIGAINLICMTFYDVSPWLGGCPPNGHPQPPPPPPPLTGSCVYAMQSRCGRSTLNSIWVCIENEHNFSVHCFDFHIVWFQQWWDARAYN